MTLHMNTKLTCPDCKLRFRLSDAECLGLDEDEDDYVMCPTCLHHVRLPLPDQGELLLHGEAKQ